MISSSDEQVVMALRTAAHRIVVPPESRWVRERHSVRAEWMLATLAVVAVVAVVGALRGEPRAVPASVSHTVPPSGAHAASASGPVTYDVSDDAPWVAARAKAAPGFVVLRPTWLPRTPDAASKCEIDSQRLMDATSDGYHVWYGSVVPGWPYFTMRHCSILFGGHRDAAHVSWGERDLSNVSPVPLLTFVARGSVFYIREYVPGVMYVQWIENGSFYEVIAEGYELSDLVRAVNSLEPVR